MKRTIVYIDGYNLYYGLLKGTKCKWLDLMAFVKALLRPDHEINEHMPEHVHVKNGSGKAKFDISDGVQLVESKGMKIPELRRAQEIAEEEVQLLKEKWHEFFD